MDEERKLQLELKRRQAELRHEEEIAQAAIFEEQQHEAAAKVFETERVSVCRKNLMGQVDENGFCRRSDSEHLTLRRK